MKKQAKVSGEGGQSYRDRLERLAVTEASDAPFLSCYVDLASGVEQARRYVETSTKEIRGAVPPLLQFDLDCALGLVSGVLDELPADARGGVAIFARGVSGGRFIERFDFLGQVSNQCTFNVLPDIAQLAALVEAERPFWLVHTEGSRHQVWQFADGGVTQRGWAGDATNLRRMLTGLGKESRGADIVWATTDPDARSNPLSARLRARLRAVVEVAPGRAVRDVLARCLADMTLLDRSAARQLARRMVQRVRAGKGAVAGHQAVNHALGRARATRLLLSKAGSASRESLIALVRSACQQKVPVTRVDSAMLDRLGGLGCFLAEPAAEAAGSPLTPLGDAA